MKIMSFLLLLALLAGLSACTTIHSYPLCDVYAKNELPILHPAVLSVPLITNQQVRIITAENQFEFISQLEVKHDRLVLVALTPIGQKLFQIQYSKANIKFERFGIPDTFSPAYLLADISLVYGKKNVLESCFQQADLVAYSLAGDNLQRSLNFSGKESIRIQYSDENKWKSDIIFTNPERNYTIRIKSLGVEYL
jgi:hypothetical protein